MKNVVLKSKVVTYKKVNEMFQETFRQKINESIPNHKNRQKSRKSSTIH